MDKTLQEVYKTMIRWSYLDSWKCTYSPAYQMINKYWLVQWEDARVLNTMIEKIKELRARTGAGVAACKGALTATNLNMEEAVLWLRKQGQIENEKRSTKTAKEGVIGCYIHTGDKICAIVELNCETDFVARSPEFKKFAHELAMHIAASHPKWVSREDVPQHEIDTELTVIKSKIDMNKPENIVEKIIQGRLDKFFKDVCLLEQVFIKDNALSIQDLLNSLAIEIKENIIIKRFERMEVGT